MYCRNCGTTSKHTAPRCPVCRRPVFKGVCVETGRQTRLAVRDAAAALVVFGPNPAASLGQAFDQVGAGESLRASLALGCLWLAAFAPGMYLLFPGAGGRGAIVNVAFQTIAGVLAFGVTLAAQTMLRYICRGTGSIDADAFGVAAALVPLGLAVLAAGLLASTPPGLVLVVILPALTHAALALYGANTHLARLPEPRAAFAVPVSLACTVWSVWTLSSALR